MLLTIALVVLGSSILVFFSQEFGAVIKMLFNIPGVKLILPTALVSLLVAYYEPWVLWALLALKATLHGLAKAITDILPFETGDWLVAEILLLMIITMVPVLLINLWSIKKTFERFKHPYLLSSILWITTAVLLVMELPTV